MYIVNVICLIYYIDVFFLYSVLFTPCKWIRFHIVTTENWYIYVCLFFKKTSVKLYLHCMIMNLYLNHQRVVNIKVMVILYHCTIAVHLQYEDEEKGSWNSKLRCLFFFFPFPYLEYVAEAAVGQRCWWGHLEEHVHVDGDWGAARFWPVGVCCHMKVEAGFSGYF